MSSVLVTGGTGVMGSWVARRLVDQGAEVVAYSRHPDTSLISDIADRVKLVSGDILDLPSIIHTIKTYGVERIIHMSTVLPDQLNSNPFTAYRINVDGTMNILEAARLMDIKRVVYTSTVGVYAQSQGEYAYPTYKPMEEDYPKVPMGIYDATKFFCENMALNYNRLFGTDVVINRFAFTYGPGKQARHGILSIHSKIIESAMLGKPMKIPQGGDEKLDMIYVRDVAKGIVLACFAENLEERVFNIGTGTGETFSHMIEILKNVLGDVPIEIGPGLNPMGVPKPSYRVLSIERARRELGYEPDYDLEAAVKDYIETLRRLDIAPVVLS